MKRLLLLALLFVSVSTFGQVLYGQTYGPLSLDRIQNGDGSASVIAGLTGTIDIGSGLGQDVVLSPSSGQIRLAGNILVGGASIIAESTLNVIDQATHVSLKFEERQLFSWNGAVSLLDWGSHSNDKLILGVGTKLTSNDGNTSIDDTGLNTTAGANIGGVFITALPTTDPGVSGQLWNDSGTVKVSP